MPPEANMMINSRKKYLNKGTCNKSNSQVLVENLLVNAIRYQHSNPIMCLVIVYREYKSRVETTPYITPHINNSSWMVNRLLRQVNHYEKPLSVDSITRYTHSLSGLITRLKNIPIPKLKSAEIIPNILPVFDPSTDLQVTYVNRAMNFGTEYFPFKNETDNLPTFNYEADSDDFYTLALIDPDAPSRANPFRSQVRHWLSVNIPGKNVAAGNSTGTPYLAPRPFPGCGRKRFVYVLAKQQSNMPNLSVPAARPNFNIADFAKANNMEIIGANYFQVEAQPGATCTIPGAATSTTSTTANGYKTTSATTKKYDNYRTTRKGAKNSKCHH
ncbi:hypothetical protein BB561_002509 [Smittium simulii]|uniref:Phosphatidylethanolamine-binding protein n=1 Tax=Smittium simulii TaxID=133385 RepID=A0A2T9YQ64_9FUNG|nr:hypothetical protein BB561_002509 [Smittium simulii]